MERGREVEVPRVGGQRDGESRSHLGALQGPGGGEGRLRARRSEALARLRGEPLPSEMSKSRCGGLFDVFDGRARLSFQNESAYVYSVHSY